MLNYRPISFAGGMPADQRDMPVDRALSDIPAIELPGPVLLEAMPVPAYVTDAAGRLIFANTAAQRFCLHEVVPGQPAYGPWRLLDETGGDLPHDHWPLAIALATRQPIRHEGRAIRPDGSTVWFSSSPTPLFDAGGALIGAVDMLIDLTAARAAETELAQAEERYRYAAMATRDVFWDHDLASGRIIWSDGLTDTFGHPLDERSGRTDFWVDRIHPEDRDRVLASREAVMAAGGQRWTAEYRFARADGSYAHVLDCGTLLREEDGQAVRAIGAMLDFSERRQTQAELELSEERLRLAIGAAGLGFADFAVFEGKEHWSDELRRILGVPASAPAGADTYLARLHPDDLPGALEHHRRTSAGDFDHEFRALRRIYRQDDGALRWIKTQGHVLRNAEGVVHRVLITARDVTDEKTAQDRISWAASHDALTGLPNKAAFQSALEALTTDPVAPDASSLLLIDLDNFKHVNDTLGHQAGDTLLVDVAARLRAALPSPAVVARFGGDEFAIIMPGVGNAIALTAGREILAALAAPSMVDARSVDVRASVGVASYPVHGSDASTLLQAADIALYAAKAGGRYAVRTYTADLRAGLQRQVSTLRQTRNILAAGSIRPFYQPKVSLGRRELVGAEALLRWRDPRGTFQPASSIAAAFDDPELGARIGDVMLSTVLADMRGWLQAGRSFGRIAINVSPAEVSKAGYADRLLRALDEHGVPADRLEVEITETALLGGKVEGATHELAGIRQAGVTVALDDFGTGFSSLSHLTSFPVDTIKIDRTFVAGLNRPGPDQAVVEAVLLLSRNLGLVTVAEGVETEEQAAWLRAMGCDLAQGHLFAAALPAVQYAAMSTR